MFGLGPATRVYLAVGATDLRKGFEGLFGLVKDRLELEPPVGVQMHDGKGKNRQAYLWQYSRPKGPVVFDFRLGREREGPKRFLGNFAGILQSDGYGGYDRLGARNGTCRLLGTCKAQIF